MGVRKRHNKWWVDFSFNRVRYRRPSPENTRAGAAAYEAVLKQRLAKGESIAAADAKENKPLTFKEFIPTWFNTYVKNNNKPSEISSKKMILRVHLVPFFGSMKICRIGSLEVEKYKALKVKAGLNPKTINNQLTVLHKSLQCAVEWSIIDRCPTTKKLKVPPHKFDHLTVEESNRLIDSADGILRDMIIVALGTGMRFGELIGLTWGDVDLSRRELTVRQAFAGGVLGSTKSNKIRVVPMTESVYSTLYQMRRNSGYVFADKKGKHLVQSTCVRRLCVLCAKAGLRPVGWHVLRHTFASHLAQTGANLIAVQNLLGHSDIHMTMRYAHINGGLLKEAIDSLNVRHNN